MAFTLSVLVTGMGIEDITKTGKGIFFFTDILYVFYHFILSLFSQQAAEN